MKNRILKSTTFKLIILVLVVVLSLISSTLLFNNQIDKLKNQIDNLYFGNFIPIVKLRIISENYQKIISCRTMKYICDFKKEQEAIQQEWEYYFNTYKTDDEKIVVEAINDELVDAFKANKLYKFKNMKKKIEFLVDYETKVAFKQRKEFINDYKQMKDFLFYSIVFILILAFALIAFIIFQVIKKDNQLRILNKQYKIDSITDGLTKLYNRKYFDNIFDNMPFISNANNWDCAFIMIDIDYFKQYNDTYGHDKGDEALIEVSNILRNYFDRQYEFVFRLGGEEFGVILFDINENIVENCLKDINNKILEAKIEHKNSKILDIISISIGAVIYEPNTYISANRLYKKADECLYKSKQTGRNRYNLIKGTD